MNIEDAFQAPVIQELGVDVDPEEETTLNGFLAEVLSNGDIQNPAVLEVCVLAFVAGRAYQTQFQSEKGFSVFMTPELASQFMLFLTEQTGR